MGDSSSINTKEAPKSTIQIQMFSKFEMTDDAMEPVRPLAFVNWLGLYEPTDKVSLLLMGKRRPVDGGGITALTIQPVAFQPY
jgi:hypothetical protein